MTAEPVRWPWPALDTLTGGIPPATLTYVVGYSGRGKSTFARSALLKWAEQGVKVDVLPLEVTPKQFVIDMAAMEAGYDPGLIMSRDYLRLPDAEEIRRTMARAGEHVTETLFYEDTPTRWQNPIRVDGASGLDVLRLEEACHRAVERRAQVLLIDHIDHIQGERDDVTSSFEVNNAALRLALTHDLTIIALSQANNASLVGNRDALATYAPLRENAVLWGNKKRTLCYQMLSLFRPVREPDRTETPEDYKAAIKAARTGERPVTDVLSKGVMGVSLMKSRAYGVREGSRCLLAVKGGRVEDYEALPYSLR